MNVYRTGEVLKMLRARQGARNQKQLAAEIGVSQQFLSDVFAGKRGPGTRILIYLGLETVYVKTKTAA